MLPSFLQNIPTTDQETHEEKLWNMIESGMYKRNEYPKNNFHASSAYCPKFNMLTLNQTINNDAAPSLSLYAALGDCVENFVTNALVASNKLITTQFKPLLHPDDPEIKLSGVVDIMYINHSNQLSILEVKNVGLIDSKETLTQKKDGTLTKYKKQGIRESGPPLSHITQASIYSALTGLNNTSILYISRNVIEKFGNEIAHYIYEVDTSYNTLLNVMSDLYFAQLCYDYEIVPVRPSHFRKSNECKFCSLQSECWANKLPDIETERHKEIRIEAAKLSTEFMKNLDKRTKLTIDILESEGKLRLP